MNLLCQGREEKRKRKKRMLSIIFSSLLVIQELLQDTVSVSIRHSAINV